MSDTVYYQKTSIWWYDDCDARAVSDICFSEFSIVDYEKHGNWLI